MRAAVDDFGEAQKSAAFSLWRGQWERQQQLPQDFRQGKVAALLTPKRPSENVSPGSRLRWPVLVRPLGGTVLSSYPLSFKHIQRAIRSQQMFSTQ